MQEYLKITRNGLWNNNQALVALLGLCPLLAVTNNVANAISLGIATTFVLIASNLSVSIFRNYIRKEVRIPIFVLLIASFVTFFDQYQGTLIALLPPGAFIGLGLIVALKNLIDSRQIAPQTAANSKATLEPQTN